MRHLSAVSNDQSGVAALAVTLLLLFVMMLGATYVNRDLLFEQRSSANQYRAAQAFEAAEAGLAWAEAQLDSTQRLTPECRPVNDPVATSFRERFLLVLPATGMVVPRTWVDAGTTSALQPACVKSATGWSCSCPAHGAAAWTPPTGVGPFPAFSLQFLPGSHRGTVRVVSTGCSGPGAPCNMGAAPADATARVEVSLGLIGGLRTAPSATVTAGGTVDATASGLTIANLDPTTGIAVRAGGSVVGGATGRARTIERDPTLAALGAGPFFAAFFGLDKAHWKAQPSVSRVTCQSDCTAALEQSVRNTPDIARVWIDGDLELNGPTVLGSSAHPVLIVVGGDARLRGAVELHGALYAGSVTWADAAAGAELRGALLTEGDYRGNAAATLAYDAQALAALTASAGSFVRISGSWRDF